MDKYEKLKTEYSTYVTLDQLRVICKIAKRTASYLVTNGIIPSIDTGKKTWRYKILLNDVIGYLKQREQSGSMVPKGAVTSRKTGRRKVSFSQEVAAGEEYVVAEYFAHIYADYSDVLRIDDLANMTGLHKKSFQRIIKAGKIRYIASSPKYIIPKVYFWEFIASRRFIDAWSNSEAFIRVMEGFKAWQATR